MAFIFQCDCCGQREPEVILAATFMLGPAYEEQQFRFEVCKDCKPLLQKEVTALIRRVKEHHYGNT